MKKETKRALPFWIVLVVAGLAFCIAGSMLHFPLWLVWPGSLLFWLAAAVWIALHFIALSRKMKSKPSFTGNRQVYERVSREINEAIARYLQSVNRRGFFKYSALYERPWFLVCGPEKSGKTQLLSGCGVHFPLKYPAEHESTVLAGSSGISWNFANEAVWVDMPGVLTEAGGTDEWRATVHAIKEVRSQRAIDSVVLVVGADTIMASDPRKLKELAGSLRGRIDDLIAIWGIEFPVYLVIHKSDVIQGFNELFRDPAGKWNEQILGATLSSAQQKLLPKQAFAEEYELLCSSLRDMRLRMLAREKNEERRRLMCRFVIHFEGLQLKLADFIAELFKSSMYEGKPVFRGFYFTSTQTIEAGAVPETAATPIDVSNTIINHPLNPHRVKMPDAQPVKDRKKDQIAFFTSALFKEIVPTGTALVKKTQRFTRKELIRYYTVVLLVAAAVASAGWYLFVSARNTVEMNNDITAALTTEREKFANPDEAYEALRKMGNTIAIVKKYHESGAPFSMGLGLYKGEKLYPALKVKYFDRLQRLIVNPAARYLEYRIKQNAETSEGTSSDAYNDLYRCLKAYLSLSEAVSGRLELIDTLALREVILEAVTSVILSNQNASRLSENVETALQTNVGIFLSYLRKGEFPLFQENQYLVSDARQVLVRLPNAQALYESAINRASPDAPQLTLDELLGRTEPGILNTSMTISSLYTQGGWDQFVAKALSEACKDPYKIDWVMGTTKEQMPDAELDPDDLLQEMTGVYYDDVKNKWIAFLSSVTVEPFGELERCGRMLQKIGGNQSELLRLFTRVAELTQINTEANKEVKVPGALTTAVNKKIKKATKMKVDVSTFLKSGVKKSSLSDLFDPFRTFVKSGESGLGGFTGYKDKILIISEKLLSIQSLDGDNVVALFNGKSTDPLFDAWTYANNALSAMPEELAQSIKQLLLSPMVFTGKAVGGAIKKQLNTLWQNDVTLMYNNRFLGKYPFLQKDDEASFTEVMDFFRPATGIFWGFYDRRLSPFIVKNNNQWQVKTVGTVEIGFSPKLIEALQKAERIRDMFYQPDGTQRVLELTLSSVKTNKNRAVFTMGDKEFQINPGTEEEKARINWPAEAASKTAQSGVSMKIYANESVVKDFAYSGRWGLIRLFEGARISVVNPQSFVSKWQINVQNMYMIYFSCRVTVSGSDHPFCERIFNEFALPTSITAD